MSFFKKIFDNPSQFERMDATMTGSTIGADTVDRIEQGMSISTDSIKNTIDINFKSETLRALALEGFLYRIKDKVNSGEIKTMKLEAGLELLMSDKMYKSYDNN